MINTSNIITDTYLKGLLRKWSDILNYTKSESEEYSLELMKKDRFNKRMKKLGDKKMKEFLKRFPHRLEFI